MDGLPFIKMHGLGNDFVVIDAREAALALEPAWVRAVADRRTGVGCDQLIVIEPSTAADARMTIRNADGGIAEACGNGSRCVAALLMGEGGPERVTIETAAGIVECRAAGEGRVTVDMGEARLDWRDIPLAREADTLDLDLGRPELGGAVAVNPGVPHIVFFVDDAEAIDVAGIGAALEHDAMFPARANINFAHLAAPGRLRMRVWERGAGVTRACGTGACAVLVAAARRGLAGREGEVVLDGGVLAIAWRADGHVLMTGPAATSFRGRLDPGLAAKVGQ